MNNFVGSVETYADPAGWNGNSDDLTYQGLPDFTFQTLGEEYNRRYFQR